MTTRIRRSLTIAISLIAAVAILAGTVTASEGTSGAATGGGHFLYAGFLDVEFGFGAVANADGSAQGSFHQSYTLEGLTTSYWGTVTCLSVDTAKGRAWIGGVLSKVESDDPTVTRQPGEDVWFRVLDSGQGQDDADRSTVFGFVPLFESSAAYCAGRPWPAANARTWPVIAGNISVR